MPEVHVEIAWPDGARQLVYSPSLVVTDHLVAGATYPVDEVVRRLTTALAEASDRVQASYGLPCVRAAASSAAVRQAATGQTGEATVVRFLR